MARSDTVGIRGLTENASAVVAEPQSHALTIFFGQSSDSSVLMSVVTFDQHFGEAAEVLGLPVEPPH